MINKIPIKMILTLLIFLGSFFLGYKYHSYKTDSESLVALQAAKEVSRVFEKRESEIAKVVEDRLSSLKDNEKIIEKRTREIVERPIYLSQCIDQDGLDIINSYAKGGVDEEN